MIRLQIDNSYASAVKTGSWKNPGAKLYDKLLDGLDWKGDSPVDVDDLTTGTQDYLEEAYLIVGKVKNNPYGRTPFSRSGCKYPHHVVKGERLVVSIPGLRAAYARAKQQGEFKGAVKKHLLRHFRELRIFTDSMVESDMRIEANFSEIESFLESRGETTLGDVKPMSVREYDYLDESPHLEEDGEYLTEKSQGRLNQSFRMCVNVENGHLIRVVFDLNANDVMQLGDHTQQSWRSFQADEEKRKNIRKIGNTNFSSYGTVKAIIDMDTHKSLQTVKTIGIVGNDGTRFQVPEKYRDKRLHDEASTFGAYPVATREKIAKEANLANAPDATTFTVGERETKPSYKSTRATWSTTDLYNNQWSSGKGYQAKMRDKTGIHIRTAVNELKQRAEAIRDKADPEDVEDFDYYYKRIMKIIEEQKGEGAGQTPGDSRYYRLFHNLEGAVYEMERGVRKRERIMKESFEDEPEDPDNPELTMGNEDLVKDPNEPYVPIYGISKCYSTRTERNDGTPKSKEELGSIHFSKIVSKMARGDKYSHALVSLDGSMTKMYSYEDEGFVIDDITARDSWMGTDGIYFCVMFVKKSDRDRMQAFVDHLINHKSETTYNFANLFKAFFAKPLKSEMSFICSSFTGFILQCSNPKNLHRDYSRLRPEDITVLPRAYYLMTARDRADFLQRKPEMQRKVRELFNLHKEEIDDYNNMLPKMMLKQRCDEMKTFDKILNWIGYVI